MHYHTLRRFLSDGRPFERLECGDVACDVGAGAAATAAADGVIMDAWTVGGPLHEASAAVVRSLLWPRARVERGQQWAYTAVGESAAYYPWLEEGTRWRVLSWWRGCRRDACLPHPLVSPLSQVFFDLRYYDYRGATRFEKRARGAAGSIIGQFNVTVGQARTSAHRRVRHAV
jgi:hypothetical protein